MGCRASKLQPEAELSPVLRPVRRKIEEVKKRRRKRSQRYSIMSTTELLQPDERDADNGSSRKAEQDEEEDFATSAQLTEVKEEEVRYLTSDEGPEEVYEETLVKKEKFEMAPATKKLVPAVEEEEGRKLRAVTARRGNGGEESPGSPSFRIYFAGSIHNPDPLEQLNNKANGIDNFNKIPKSDVAHRRTNSKDHSNSNEDSTSKQQQQSHRKKTKKMGAITKANVAVQHMLNVRNCYSNPPSSMEVTTNKHANNSHHLLMPMGKAA